MSFQVHILVYTYLYIRHKTICEVTIFSLSTILYRNPCIFILLVLKAFCVCASDTWLGFEVVISGTGFKNGSLLETFHCQKGEAGEDFLGAILCKAILELWIRAWFLCANVKLMVYVPAMCTLACLLMCCLSINLPVLSSSPPKLGGRAL